MTYANHTTHSATAVLLAIRSALGVPPNGDVLEAVRALVGAQHAPAATAEREALLRVLLAAQAWLAADFCAYMVPDVLPPDTPASMRAQICAVAHQEAEIYAESLRAAVREAGQIGGAA
jgi:hypothetical protein